MPFDTSKWEQVLTERESSREAERKRLIHTIRHYLPQYLSKIKGIKNAYLFGSILDEGSFYSHSDVDLAIDGIPAHLYFKIKSDLEDLFERTVDLVEWDTCSFADEIAKSGLRIFPSED
jgi:predicted nucleotidyltransferase